MASGCEKKEEIKMSDVSGKNILMVIAPEGFRDEELLEPKEVFEKNDVVVKIASKGVKEAKGKLGATASVDYDTEEVLVQDYDAVVFMGGPGASVYFDDETVLEMAREASEEGKIIGAICIAPSILANAGLLEGKKATCFESEEGNLKEKGADLTGEDVTVDGNIITGNGPGAAVKFGEKIIGLLSK